MATPDSLSRELEKVTQTTGFIAGGGLDTLQGRISSQIRTTTDIANIVHQLNVVYYNIVKTLTDGKDTGRENVLETGIAGTNIICYQDAAKGSCYWADLLEKPATIKEVFDCVLGRISDIENRILEGIEAQEYDDSSLVSRLDCIELNLLQIMKDTLGSGSYGCDGSSDFTHSLASIINALGANFNGFTPIHTGHSGETTVGPYSLSYYSSGIVWDAAVSQSNVENLTTHLACIRTAIGMSASDDCNNEYSTESPSAASSGNSIVADGDSLRKAIKALDGAIGGAGSLAGTLVVGNITGGTDIAISSGDEITGVAELILRSGGATNIDLIPDTTGQITLQSEVRVGQEGTSTHAYELSHSASKFATDGDAQFSRMILRKETTDGNPLELSTDGTTTTSETTVNIADNTAYKYRIDAVARENATGDTVWWEHRGCIKRGSGPSTTAFVGSQYVTTENDAGASAWQFNVTADTVNGSLKLEATGETSHVIRWVATVHLTKVSG